MIRAKPSLRKKSEFGKDTQAKLENIKNIKHR